MPVTKTNTLKGEDTLDSECDDERRSVSDGVLRTENKIKDILLHYVFFSLFQLI